MPPPETSTATLPGTAAPSDARAGVGARDPVHVLWWLGAATAAALAAYLLLDVTGAWGFALRLRATRAAAMAVVGSSIGVSTVLFQTATGNRILTPSIMGFDAVYLLLRSVAVFALGALAVVALPATTRFALEALAMVAFAAVLHRLLLGPTARDVHLLVLAGVVVGTLLGSLQQLVARLIDPNEFQTLQDLLFAGFGSVDARLLGVAAATLATCCAVAWRWRHLLDVVALGHATSTGLGVDHGRALRRVLAMVALLVAVATALVGPLTFLGLLVANLARQLLGSERHALVLPAAALTGTATLLGGQAVLEHVLGYATAIGVVVNVLGGVLFLALLLREGRP